MGWSCRPKRHFPCKEKSKASATLSCSSSQLLGGTRVGWVVSWLSVFLASAGVQITTCTMGSEDAWRASLYFYTPLSFLILAGILITPKHHTRTRILAIPLVLVICYCAVFVAPYLIENTFNGNHMCSILKRQPEFNAYESTFLFRVWAPIQFILLGAYAWAVLRIWSNSSRVRTAA